MDEVSLCCSKSLLTPDGSLRCSLTFLPCGDTCDEFEVGKPKIWKPEPLPKVTVTRKKKR